MGIAIPSMHYVAMMAVEYTPVAEFTQVLHAIYISSLEALLIVAALSIVLVLAVITSVSGRDLRLCRP